jgi:hypothetical protein
MSLSVGVLALAPLAFTSCTNGEPLTRSTGQAVISTPIPTNLTLVLHSKTTVSIGPFAQVFGDVGSTAIDGSVLFDVSSSQSFFGNVLATTVTVRESASVGHIYGNDIMVDGSAFQQTLGIDPTTLPAIPNGTAAVPGATDIAISANQTKQLCPGQYGEISLDANATLNLNGGIYEVSRLSLAEGARLEPSEPVVILVSGNLILGNGALIGPFPQLVNPMSAADIRIEVAGSATIGDSTSVSAHVLVPNGKFTLGKTASLTGAVWARSIAIGAQSFVSADGVFSSVAPSVPPPCNDNNSCTVDACVGGGTAVAFCRNTVAPSGTSCGDGNLCNGVEVCNSTGQCLAGAIAAAGTSCTDGDACNGDETCNGFGSCVSGPAPVVNDGNACTTDACDATAGVSHDPVPDGTSCSGSGTCQGGTCSVQGVTFSQAFIGGAGSFNQCQSWNTFLGQLTSSSYGSVTISGSIDPVGVTCNVPSAATQLCEALHNGGSVSVFCNGRTWNVGDCGEAQEISADGSTCVCDTGYVARPCVGTEFGFDNPNWGGVNTSTCDAQSQTITVTCQ